MPREVDPKATRKALRRLKRLSAAAPADEFSGWEKEFLGEVEGRLEKYGSAFANLAKGRAEEALSTLQAQKLKELEAKAKGKTAKGFKPSSGFKPRAPKSAPPRGEEDV